MDKTFSIKTKNGGNYSWKIEGISEIFFDGWQIFVRWKNGSKTTVESDVVKIIIPAELLNNEKMEMLINELPGNYEIENTEKKSIITFI